MKRLLFSFVAIMLTSVCFAQDIIVRKDGSTIKTRVIKVRKSEVEYKKYENLNGPSYTISKNDLQSITYENGTKDIFGSLAYNPNIVTNETATKYSNDKDLVDIYKSLHKTSKEKKVVTPEMRYKRGKRLKIAAYTIGGSLLAAGLISAIVGASQDKYDSDYIYVWGTNDNYITHKKYYSEDRERSLELGYGLMAGGVVIGVPLYFIGSSIQKKNSQKIQSVSVFNQDIKFGNGSNLNIGVDMLSSNYSFVKTPGIGVRYNF